MNKKIISIFTSICILMGLVVPGTFLNATAASELVTLLDENFNSYNIASIAGQGGWTITNSSVSGHTSEISADPDGVDADDKVLDVEIAASSDASSNKYAKLVLGKSISSKKYISFSQKVRFTLDAGSSVFYAQGKWGKSGASSLYKYILQITYDLTNKTMSQSRAAGGNAVIAENVNYSLNEWINMEFVLDVNAKTFDVYMDNTKINTEPVDVYFNSTDSEGYALTDINTIEIGSIRSNRNVSHIYSDDVVIYGFDSANYIGMNLRMAKMYEELTSAVLTGQTEVSEDFTPNIPYLEESDSVEITCDDSAFVYDETENKVTVTQGETDKTLTVTVKVTSAEGDYITKEISVTIPKIEAVTPEPEPEVPGVTGLLSEKFDSYSKDASVSGQGNWSVENESLVGNTSFIKSDPEPENSNDKVLDIEVVTNNDSSANKYAKLLVDKGIDGKKYIMFSEKVRFTEGIISSVFYTNCTLLKGAATPEKQELIQFTYDLKNGKFVHSIVGNSSEVIAENVTIPVDEWIDMKFVVDVEEQEYYIYMNDVKMNESPMQIYKQLEGYTINNINNIRVGSIRHNNTAGHIYVDDIKITAFDNPDNAGLDLRMQKMENALTANILTGQTNVSNDFIPNIPYLEDSDSVEISCGDSAFVYDETENKVTVTPGSEDKTVSVTVSVTSIAGKTMSKTLEVFIPKVFTDDFDSTGYESLELSEEYSTSSDYHFNVSKSDASVTVTSDNLCYFSADDYDANKFIDDIPRKEAGHSRYPMAPSYGLNYQFVEALIKPLSESTITVEDASDKNKPLFDMYDWVGPNASATYYAEDVEGKSAIGQFTYIRTDKYKETDATAAQTNEVKFEIDNNVFSSQDNNLTIEVEYYTEDDGTYTIYYPTDNGNQGTLSLSGLTKGAWSVAKFNVTDADFSHYLLNGQGNSLRINANQNGNTIYYHKVSVYRTPAEDDYFIHGNNVKLAYSDIPLTTDTRVSFNVNVPQGRTDRSHSYNDDNIRFAYSMLDYYDNVLLSLVWDKSGSSSKIYVLYGDNEKSVLCEKDFIANNYLYTITMNPDAKTFTVSVKDGEGNVVASLRDIDIVGIDNYEGDCSVMSMQISHSKLSPAVIAEFNNIVIYSEVNEDAKKCGEEMKNLTLEEKVSTDFILPVVGNIYPDDVTVSWEAEAAQSYLTIDGNIASVVGDEDEHTVRLIATIVCGDYSITKNFDITISSMNGMYAQISSVTETPAGDGTVSASMVVKNAGTVKDFGDGAFVPFEIKFIGVSYNPDTGIITDRKPDVESVTSPYDKLEFNISGLAKAPGDITEYYLWDDNNMPLVNNAPTEISNVSSESKYRSVNVSWDQSYDDHNADVCYEIYRDGNLIDKCKIEPVDGKIIYRDGSSGVLDKLTHNYQVRAVDTNENGSNKSKAVSGNTSDMPYKLVVKGTTADDFVKEGVSIVTGMKPENDAYFQITTKLGKECIYTPFPTGTAKPYYTPTFKSDKSKISSAVRKVVAEVTYLDVGTGTMNCIYWSTSGRKISKDEITLTNTNKWKVAVFEMDDTSFIESDQFSRGDFGFYSTTTSLYIQKVEIAKSEDY